MLNVREPGERAFGLSVGTMCLLVAASAHWRSHQSVASVLLVVGAVLLVLGAVFPPALRLPNKIWERFAQLLGWVNSRVLLTVLFAIVITPVGMLMRTLGRDPVRVGRSASNWLSYPARRRDARHYDRMF
jgi:multisubunit Na+/H+ antiporter MnhG subunit